MKELSAMVTKAQQAGALNPLYKIVLTKGASTYTYEAARILPSEHDEEMYSHRAKIVLDNSDKALNSLDLKGYDAVISYGFVKEYSATAPLSVIDQQFDSTPNKLTCTLELEGMPNLMAADEASEIYTPDEDDTKTVKTLVNAIVGATLAPFTHCAAFDVVWDAGYDILADSYKPKDSFRIYTGGSRLAALRRVLDFTANVPRFEADGKVHILKPVTTGESFDYEYDLESGHTFFSKAYRNSLVFPNRVVVTSKTGDDPWYSGEAQVEGYDSLPAKVKKTKYVQVRLESDNQAEDMAEALIAKAEMGAARGQAEVRINVGAEVFDYVKVTDQRQGDTRIGNLGYIHRRFGKDKWVMTFGFGNWLEYLRYQKILKELETYTDAGQYFSRLQVGDLYAENLLAKNMGFYWLDPDNTIDLSKIGDNLDNLPDGEQYARVSTWNLSLDEDPESPTYGLFILKMDEHVVYQPGYDPNEKRRTFTATPTTPYDVGDLWVDAATVKRCVTARASGAYVAGDWIATTLDAIANGDVFSRVKSISLSPAGLVLMDQVQEGTYGKIQTAALSAAGLVLLDQVVDGTYGKLRATQISAGKIYLSSASSYGSGYDPTTKEKGVHRGTTAPSDTTLLWWDTNINEMKRYSGTAWVVHTGEWYDRAGVEIDAETGINIYGPDVAFRTRATKTGAIQCYVGTDGCIYAGAGAVKLSASGLYLYGEMLKFYYGTGYRGYAAGTATSINVHATTGYNLSLAGNAVYIIGNNGDIIFQGASYRVDMSGMGYLYLPTRTNDPTAVSGGAYYNTNTGEFRVCRQGTWRNIQVA